MYIRKTKESDKNDIEKLHLAAFIEEGVKVAAVTHCLLNDKSAPNLSLAAIENEKIVGHILFTKATISGHKDIKAQMLTPLAVHPSVQKRGIGKMLIKEGLKQLKDNHVDLVFVAGIPEYYPKCGFLPKAESLGFTPPHPMPKKYAAAWMVYELKSGLIGKIKGKIRCLDVINEPENWTRS